jgi:hypothetical protein
MDRQYERGGEGTHRGVASHKTQGVREVTENSMD